VPCDPARLAPSDPSIVGTNCRPAPATTVLDTVGGGEIVCDPVPGASPSGPPLTDTAVPDPGGGRGDDPAQVDPVDPSDPDEPVSSPPLDPAPADPGASATTIVPDASTGVIQGYAVGGLDCDPGDPCPAIGIVVQGSVGVIRYNTEPAPRTVAEIGFDGSWGARLRPGTYTVIVDAEGDDRCEEVIATVTAGQVTEVPMTCVRPQP
jgi:hypothetical protein